MKVGIFTISNALNYGAFYQMYAMYKHLSDLGLNVTIYDCEKSLKHKIIKNFARNPKKLVFKRKLIKNYKQDANNVTIEKYKGEHLDIAFLGSDEIWNIDNPHFYHAPEFFGINVNANKKIAYAPSVGFCNTDNILNKDSLVCAIKNIDAYFPRDLETKTLIDKVNTHTKPVIESVDPTILYGKWDAFKSSRSKKNDVIVYYSYDNNPPFKDELLSFAKKNKLKIVSAGFINDWADESTNCGPFEFLRLLDSSKYVITTTFHGTIMSALLDCNFICIPNGQKAKNLVDKFGLHNNVLSSNRKISELFKNNSTSTNSRKFEQLSLMMKDKLACEIFGESK